MAASSVHKSGPKKKTQSRSSSGRSRTSTSTSSSNRSNRGSSKLKEHNSAIQNEILLIGILALAVLMFLCNFGVIGTVGNAVSGFLFGIFGFMAYLVPVLIFVAVAFGISNRGNYIASMKMVAGVVLFLLIGVVCELTAGNMVMEKDAYNMLGIYTASSKARAGGGILCGSLAYAMYQLLGMVGTILVIIVLGIACIVAVTEKSFLGGVKKGSKKVYETAEKRRELSAQRKEIYLQRREEQLLLEAETEEKQLRMDNKVSGVMVNTAIGKKETALEDMHEILLSEETVTEPVPVVEDDFDFDKIHITGINLPETENIVSDLPRIRIEKEPEITIHREAEPVLSLDASPKIILAPSFRLQDQETQEEMQEEMQEEIPAAVRVETPIGMHRIHVQEETARISPPEAAVVKMPKQPEEEVTVQIHGQEKKIPRKYVFPPIALLKKNEKKNNGDSAKQLKATALRLQQTLNTFGVKVTITDISQGPAVTRYELQPEQGVKVSRIVGLTDDIKLNLAATDIRMEAPIPGKAAIGIEVPNKENSMVGLRELLETEDFVKYPSKLAFAVGKDISGHIMVSDIAKMPHMLIAGSTGSGKSVCINTLIMGILYKAHPDDVKMIMIDPKVVELSVYNGIPHLLIPVVTDPKKAAAALHWGVAEMTDRYKKFADYNVRDLKGYNQRVETMAERGELDVPEKMPQIVIIVDELADLMMVAPGEVEESICRLAQLARAAGIHLIIATQRPSVDVITGLIKANMPSRVAFAVSSGVDSRTILDMNGAEKLLGKGDMLFYPQGLSKPVRVQGAFVSDDEVSDVVDFLKNQAIGNVYSEDVEEKIQTMGVSSGGAGGSGEEKDAYFMEAAKFIIDKDKASIGMLQRVFKIGFNRAARIMDQLTEAGVVGEEEGTKPRKVQMSMEQFESYIEES